MIIFDSELLLLLLENCRDETLSDRILYDQSAKVIFYCSDILSSLRLFSDSVHCPYLQISLSANRACL